MTQPVYRSVGQATYRLCLGVAACVISAAALEALPAEAAAFSFSGSRLTLDAANAQVQAKDSTLVTDAIALANSSVNSPADSAASSVDNTFNGNLDFVSDEKISLDGLFETRSLGEGDRYFGQSQIASNAFAQFLVTPEQPFSLNFQFASFLKNVVDTPVDALTERATAQSSLSLSLLDPNQNVLKFFTLDAKVNTSPFDQINNEALQVITNGQILGSDRQLVGGGDAIATEETGNLSFLGRFDHSVSQPTLLTLQINTRNQSCVQAPSTEDSCVKVPEASMLWAFCLATIVGLGLLPRRLRLS